MLTKRFFKTRDDVEVTFTLDVDDCQEAALLLESTDWEPEPMKRADRGKGPFRIKKRLPKGQQIRFRYLLDGQRWVNDHAADAYWRNDHGSDDSVVFTG